MPDTIIDGMREDELSAYIDRLRSDLPRAQRDSRFLRAKTVMVALFWISVFACTAMGTYIYLNDMREYAYNWHIYFLVFIVLLAVLVRLMTLGIFEYGMTGKRELFIRSQIASAEARIYKLHNDMGDISQTAERSFKCPYCAESIKYRICDGSVKFSTTFEHSGANASQDA